jgi:hypothetical protein
MLPISPTCLSSRWPMFLCTLLFIVLSGCRLRDDGDEKLVVPELVRTHLYVAPNGSDSNPGTRAEPLRTLGRVAQVVAAGTTVHVAPGTYSGGVRTTVNGTPEARIVYQSTERWGAKIVPPLDARQSAAWANRGNYVDIIGFEIDGSQYQSGMKWLSGIYNGGSHVGVLGNRVHHIANDVPCEPKGGGGIIVDSYHKGANVAVTGNEVHDIGPPGCARIDGIGVGTVASVRNNIVYRASGAGIDLWHDASGVTVRGNTVVASGSGINVGGGDFYHSKGPNDHTVVSNNIVYDNGHGIREHGAVGAHNRFLNNLVYQNAGGNWDLAPQRQHTGTVSAAPQFVAYTLDATPDFQLQPGSPAIGQGLPGDTSAPGSADIGALPAVPAPQ